MIKTVISLAMGIILPIATAQSATADNAQQAINSLTAAVASADLTLAQLNAEEAIAEVSAREAVNALSASVSSAELTIAMVELSTSIDHVSDAAMLAELRDLLQTMNDSEASDLIVALVGERPQLAPGIQKLALVSGYSEALVVNALVEGLSKAASTAAGKPQ
ncbi:MAG: hypothetical protein P8Y42_15630 [Exilibacterium sp.]